MSERDITLPPGYEARRTVILTSIPVTLPDGSLMLDPNYKGKRNIDGSPIEDIYPARTNAQSTTRSYPMEELNSLLKNLKEMLGADSDGFEAEVLGTRR